MNHESKGLYFIRLFLSLCLLFLMAMIYWSNLLIEEKVRDLTLSLNGLKKDLSSLKMAKASSYPRLENAALATQPKRRPYINDNLPNLLEEDPFYAITLPKLLGENFVSHGSFQGATIGRPHNLHPFSNWSQVSNWYNQCTVSLARLIFGRYDAYTSNMALKIEARPLLEYQNPEAVEYWVHLRDDIYWQPLRPEDFPNVQLADIFLQKHPVTAQDFAFYLDAMMNPHVEEAGAVALRNYYDDLESIKVVDPLTLVVRWKVKAIVNEEGKTEHKIKYLAKGLTMGLKPLPRFVFQKNSDGSDIIEGDSPSGSYRLNTVWAQNFSRHWAKNIIISCGPWTFEGMSDREIKFRRTENFPYPLSALAEKNVIQFKDTPEAVWQSFKNNKIDSYTLQPDQMIELNDFLLSDLYQGQKARGAGVSRLDYLARSYNYIGWNQAKPFFASKKVRQALTMAIDRERIIAQNLNGLGIEITCPFYRYSSSYDESIKPWPYDLQEAKRLLQKEGWYDSDDDGIIDKMIDGQLVPFRFSLTYYVKNNVVKSICEYIATNLKVLGIDCQLNGVDVADISSAFDNKSFDAICLGWALGLPPEDPKQLWYSTGAHEKGSSNAVGFANAQADKIIDTLQYETNEKVRQKLYHQFDAIIYEEAPYTFLYSPKTVFLYRDYLQNVFIPKDRPDLIPGANMAQPDSSAFWLKSH